MNMSAIDRRHRDLRRLRESRQRERGGFERYREEIAEIFKDRSVDLHDFSIRRMFENLVEDGRGIVDLHFNKTGGGGYRRVSEAVNTAYFTETQGQYLYNAILRSYDDPEFIGDELFTTIPSAERSERVPGVTEFGDDVEAVNEGKPYPSGSVTETWIQTPDTIKRGLSCDITKEVVFFDKTGLILQRCANIGRTIRINKERRQLDVAVGVSTVFRRNGAAAEATYASDNIVSSNPLVDYTSLDAADVQLSALTDPNTGLLINIVAGDMLVPTALANTAGRIVRAMMTGSTASSKETRVGDNSLNGPKRVLSNAYVKERTTSATTWFHGDFKRGLVYMENWPLQVENEGANGPRAFDSDIVERYKASEMGAAGVMERLYLQKCTA